MEAMLFRKYGDPDVFEHAELPDPAPSADEVLIRVVATSVNRLDLFLRNGSRSMVPLPIIPGLEAAGTVVADAHGFSAGEQVMTTNALGEGHGGYASMLAVAADRVVRIPEKVSFEQAAAAGLAASTGWAALFTLGKMRDGERVLIQAGTSGVGTAQVQFVKMRGGWVAATAGGPGKAAELKALGVDLVIDHRNQPVGATVRDAGGVNLVMENVGSTLAESLTACLPDARIVLIGNAGGTDATINTQALRFQRITIIGGGGMHASTDDELAILQMIASGQFKPAMERVMPISQVAEAHRLIEANQVFGKIVLVHPA